jgi:hypothetical protein
MALFQRFMGAALLFRVSTEFRFAEHLWGPHSIGGWQWGNLLDRPFETADGAYALLAVLGAAALALLVQVHTRIAVVVAWFTFNLLAFRTEHLNDGGDNLAQLALLYMIALLPAGASAAPGSLRVWFHNLAVLAVCIQVCIVYFVAGFAKAHGDTWQNGTALYLISQVEWFSWPATRDWFANGLIATGAAYATVLFQVWFPVAMCSRLKMAFLQLAILFHVGIAVSMGLLTFSVIMAGADLSLITDDEYSRLRARWGYPA